jgi:predicted transposase/invertase (TIGR01784 family)
MNAATHKRSQLLLKLVGELPKAFEKAEISNYTESERRDYEDSLKVYRDLKGVIDTAFDEGKLEGLIAGKLEGLIAGKQEGLEEGQLKSQLAIAKKLKDSRMDTVFIMEITGLSAAQIALL